GSGGRSQIGDGGTRSGATYRFRSKTAMTAWKASVAVPFAVGPRVRIRFPPAESLRTIGSATVFPFLGQGDLLTPTSRLGDRNRASRRRARIAQPTTLRVNRSRITAR